MQNSLITGIISLSHVFDKICVKRCVMFTRYITDNDTEWPSARLVLPMYSTKQTFSIKSRIKGYTAFTRNDTLLPCVERHVLSSPTEEIR